MSDPRERLTPKQIVDRPDLLTFTSHVKAREVVLDLIRALVAQERADAAREEREAVAPLIARAYISGQRDGWEPGESVDETMVALRDWLANNGHEDLLRVDADDDDDPPMTEENRERLRQKLAAIRQRKP